MHRLLRALILALPLAANASPDRPRRFPQRDVAGDSVTKRFVVEAAEGVPLDVLRGQLVAAGMQVLRTFDSDVFAGLTVESGVDVDADALRRLGGGNVARAWPVLKIPLPKTIDEDVGVSGLSLGEGAGAQNWSIHHSTGVDRLHAAGVLGKGVKVAVIDSGVDYRHEAVCAAVLSCACSGCSVLTRRCTTQAGRRVWRRVQGVWRL